MFTFLDSGLSASPYYQEVLERVKQGETFLDLGCCFGQELRVLVSCYVVALFERLEIRVDNSDLSRLLMAPHRKTFMAPI